MDEKENKVSEETTWSLETEKTEADKKSKKKISVSKKGIIITVVCLLAVIIIGGGVFCIVTEQNPVEAVQSIFTSREEAILGNWQSQDKPDLVAYVFYENGTYDSFLSNFNFDGEYTIDGNKLSLYNPDTEKRLVYKFTIYGDVLTLTLIEEDGEEVKDQEVSKYDKVDELNMRSLTDIIGQLKDEHDEKESSTETTTENK